MIQDLFDTGKTIYELSASLPQRAGRERHKLANLLELIGHLMADAAARLKQGQLPASKGQQLELLSEELYFRLAFSLGEIKAQALSRKLKHGYLAAFHPSQTNHHTLASQHHIMIEEAAQYFLAAAERVNDIQER